MGSISDILPDSASVEPNDAPAPQAVSTPSAASIPESEAMRVIETGRECLHSARDASSETSPDDDDEDDAAGIAVFRTRRGDYIATLEQTVFDLENVVLELQYSCKEATSWNETLQQDIEHMRQLVAQPEAEPNVSAPRSDACTLSLSTRPSSPAATVDVDSRRARSPSLITSEAPSVSPGGTQSSTPGHLRRSDEVSNMTTSIAATTVLPDPARPETATSTPPQARSSAGLSWHCRNCGKDPCEDPTATQCGHIFCYRCIVKEIAENMQCPVCNNLFLLRLQAF